MTFQRHRTSQLSDENLARCGVIHEEQCENDVEVSGSKQGWRVLCYGENGPEYLEKRLSGDSGRVLLELTAKFKRKGMSTNIKESSRKLGRRFTGVEERRECLFEFSAVKSAKEEDN